jgi:PHD/YefM family antitoxin component YafN of YafNO toxin-antitoxin module
MKIPEVVTVSTARSKLSQILAELTEAGPAANPVLIGAHRKPQGVLLSIEAYEELKGRAAR